MSDCLFCKIVAGQIPAKQVFDGEHIFGFLDINPQAPFHALLIPKRHVATLNDVGPEDAGLLGNLLLAASTVAKTAGYQERGYRTVVNCNQDAGQTVFHVHVHVLAGRSLSWPPG